MSSVAMSRGSYARPIRWGKITSTTIVYLLAIVSVLIALWPIFWIILTSIRPLHEITSTRLQILPQAPTLENYVNVFTRYKTSTYLANSMIVSTGTVIFNLILGAPAAYAMARFSFRGERILFGMIIIFRMIPMFAAMIPLFMIFSSVMLLDTLTSLIIAETALKLPVTIWLLRNFFIDVPKELDESARVDGCSTWGGFFRIALPLIQPGLAAAAVLAFLWTWNDLIVTLILSNTDKSTMLPLGITKFLLEFGVDWGSLTACGVLMFIPTVLFVFIAERYLVAGLTLGGVKE